jgi:DNA-binding transcriptional LysR family regulator
MADPPDLESLRLLVLVRDRGSLTAAAAELGISQPAASKRLTGLERALSLSLVDRTRRGSTLTPAGAAVCGWATEVLAGVHALVEGAAGLRRDQEASLSIAASLTLAENLLPGWIGDLRRSAPDLRVGLQVANSARVCELARSGAVDVGFIESRGRVPGLRSVVVARDRLVLVVSPAHEWAGRQQPVGPEELAATPLVTREPGSGTRETADHALGAAGTRAVRPLLELGSSTAVRTAVADGAGPALISEFAVASDLADGHLVEVPATGIDLRRRLRAVWRSGTLPTGPAAALLASVTHRQQPLATRGSASR